MYYPLERAPRPVAEKGAQAFEKLEPCIKPYTRGETVDYGAILGVALPDPRICSLPNLYRSSLAAERGEGRGGVPPQVADGSNRHERPGKEAVTRGARGG
jgi:hypothetical protein